MDNKQENNKTRGPLARRDFLRVVGSVVAACRRGGRQLLLADRPGQMHAMRALRDRLRAECFGRQMFPCQPRVRLLRFMWRLLPLQRERIEHRRRELDVSDGRDTTSVRGGSLFRVHDRRELVQRVREMREGMRLVWQRIALSSDQARPLYGL